MKGSIETKSIHYRKRRVFRIKLFLFLVLPTLSSMRLLIYIHHNTQPFPPLRYHPWHTVLVQRHAEPTRQRLIRRDRRRIPRRTQQYYIRNTDIPTIIPE